MKRFLISILLCAAFVSSTFAQQESWTLEECISYAHKNNLQIKQQEIAVKQAENNVRQSKLDFIPSFNASANHNFNWGKSVNINDLEIVNQLTQSTSANISASAPIIDGLSKQNTVRSYKTQLLISLQDVEKLKNEISIAITQAYLQILLSKEIEKCAQESFNSVEAQVNKTRILVDAGSQPYSSLLDIQAQLATERVQLVTAKNDVRTNTLTLVQLMDLPAGTQFEIEAPATEIISGAYLSDDITAIYQKATSLPQIRSAELQLEKSRYDYKVTKGHLFPSITFSAGYGTYYSDTQQAAFFTQFNENRNPSLGFGLSIPIFNGWRTSTSVKNARLAIKNAEIELKNRYSSLYKDIQQAHTNAANSFEKYQAAKQNMAASKESFDYTEKKFNAGVVNSTDYTVAKANLFKAQSEFYQTIFQYLFQLKILDFYSGVPIKL